MEILVQIGLYLRITLCVLFYYKWPQVIIKVMYNFCIVYAVRIHEDGIMDIRSIKTNRFQMTHQDNFVQ
jgi:hypothetical protein